MTYTKKVYSFIATLWTFARPFSEMSDDGMDDWNREDLAAALDKCAAGTYEYIEQCICRDVYTRIVSKDESTHQIYASIVDCWRIIKPFCEIVDDGEIFDDAAQQDFLDRIESYVAEHGEVYRDFIENFFVAITLEMKFRGLLEHGKIIIDGQVYY